MQINQLKRKNENKKKRQIGRGGLRGKTSGRGMKGQKSRAGRKMRPEIRDIIKKLPKLRGYRFSSFQEKPVVINLSVLEGNYKDGEEVTPATLITKTLLKMKKGKTPKVKILATGDITKKITISGCQISKTGEEKVKKAGGSIK
jgi:large subunit ribosomal protein L15